MMILIICFSISCKQEKPVIQEQILQNNNPLTEEEKAGMERQRNCGFQIKIFKDPTGTNQKAIHSQLI